jgi:hypothetical protein
MPNISTADAIIILLHQSKIRCSVIDMNKVLNDLNQGPSGSEVPPRRGISGFTCYAHTPLPAFQI